MHHSAKSCFYFFRASSRRVDRRRAASPSRAPPSPALASAARLQGAPPLPARGGGAGRRGGAASAACARWQVLRGSAFASAALRQNPTVFGARPICARPGSLRGTPARSRTGTEVFQAGASGSLALFTSGIAGLGPLVVAPQQLVARQPSSKQSKQSNGQITQQQDQYLFCQGFRHQSSESQSTRDGRVHFTCAQGRLRKKAQVPSWPT